MFRLVKIIGGKNNAPEIERFPLGDSETVIEVGSALRIIDGVLEPAEFRPEFIVASDVRKDNNVLVYRVTPDMVFKVEFIDAAPPEIGKVVTPCMLEESIAATCFESLGKGRIVALCEDPRYVYVKFDVQPFECDC